MINACVNVNLWSFYFVQLFLWSALIYAVVFYPITLPSFAVVHLHSTCNGYNNFLIIEIMHNAVTVYWGRNLPRDSILICLNAPFTRFDAFCVAHEGVCELFELACIRSKIHVRLVFEIPKGTQCNASDDILDIAMTMWNAFFSQYFQKLDFNAKFIWAKILQKKIRRKKRRKWNKKEWKLKTPVFFFEFEMNSNRIILSNVNEWKNTWKPNQNKLIFNLEYMYSFVLTNRRPRHLHKSSSLQTECISTRKVNKRGLIPETVIINNNFLLQKYVGDFFAVYQSIWQIHLRLTKS